MGGNTLSAASFPHAASDYEKIGGGPAVRAVVDRFYELILADDQLVGFFEGTDLSTLKRHQVLLISQVLGGPANYDGRDLRDAHAGLGPELGEVVVGRLVGSRRKTDRSTV